MGLFRNKQTSMAIKEFAKIQGSSVKEVKEGIQLQIDDIFSFDDSEKQALLKKYLVIENRHQKNILLNYQNMG